MKKPDRSTYLHDVTAELEEYPLVMTVPEVADLLSLHTNTVYRMVKSGQLPAARCGKVLRISRDAVQSFLQGRL